VKRLDLVPLSPSNSVNTVEPPGKSMKRRMAGIVAIMHSDGMSYENAVWQFKRCYLIEVLTQTRGISVKQPRG